VAGTRLNMVGCAGQIKKKICRIGCVAPLCAPARWTGPRPIFYLGPDANGPGRTVCVTGLRRLAGDALTNQTDLPMVKLIGYPVLQRPLMLVDQSMCVGCAWSGKNSCRFILPSIHNKCWCRLV
jgi:hypothetical protein